MNVRILQAPSTKIRSQGGICLIERTVVAGTRHIPRVRTVSEALVPGAPLRFQRDRSNPHDLFAVKVLTDSGYLLGYLSCEFNEIVSRLIDGGKLLHASVRNVAFVGAWTRIEMAVMLDD